ncbi:MAG: hypothetical protein E7428_00700 [Ruminococcaceae bacterium]|nr:hypothetical protein [Oscillospiraceae bacterium]
MKISRLLPLFLVFCLMVSLCSCLKIAEGDTSDKVYTADLYAYVSTHKGGDGYETKSTLYNSDRYTVGIHTPVLGMEEADFFLDTMTESIVNDFKDTMSTVDKPEDGSKGVLFGDYSIHATAKYVSVLMTYQIRYPGKDPITEYRSVFYSIADQTILTLADLLGTPNLAGAAQLIIASLESDQNLALHMGEDYFSKLSLTDASVAAFFLQDGGITLYFNANTILDAYTSPLTFFYEKATFTSVLAEGMYQRIYDDSAN